MNLTKETKLMNHVSIGILYKDNIPFSTLEPEKVWSLFSMRIFKNMMNNYLWTLIIWWKRKTFIYFIKYYWIKFFWSIAIQNKKYLAAFLKHKIFAIFGLFFFLSLCKIEYLGRYTCKYFFQHVLKCPFYNLHF